MVVITGASSGIGAETAKVVAQRGAIPVLLARNEQKLAAVASQLASEHLYAPLDVSDVNEVNRTFQMIMEKYGRIDVLVNNAGFGVFESFTETSLDDFAEMMNVNYLGIVYCTKAALPAMLEARTGYIVNIASVAGKLATKKTTAYSASKHAVIGLSNALRQELQGTGVHLAVINPGPIATAFFERADPSGHYMRNLQKMRGVVLQPSQVVNQMIRAIERRKAEITMPWFAAIGVKFAHVFPRLFERITQGMLDKK